MEKRTRRFVLTLKKNYFKNFIFYFLEDELVTPPLSDGLILPGITRNSLLEIACDWNEFKISERYLTIEEIRKSIAEKRVIF